MKDGYFLKVDFKHYFPSGIVPPQFYKKEERVICRRPASRRSSRPRRKRGRI